MDPRQMPPGMNRPGVPLIGQGAPQGASELPSMDKVNPLPPGPQAMKTLRAAS